MSRISPKNLLAAKLLGAKGKSKGKKGSSWTLTKNVRRSKLIDNEIGGTLTAAEREELESLQNEMLAFRRRVAPLPIDDARQLHADLLRKAGMRPE